VDKNYFNTAILPALNEHRRGLNLPPVDNLISHIQTAADAYVTLFPSWYRGKERDWPSPLIEGDFMFYRSSEEPELGDRIQKFLKKNKLPILFTAGTAHSSARAFFEHAQKAVDKLGCSAIFLTKRRDQLPEKPGRNITWLKYVELSRLLKVSAVCVSHGGIGTVAEAMRAGVPQMVIPFAHDQFDNGRIVTELAAGRVIPAKQLTSENLEKALAELLRDKEIEAQCMRIAKKFQSDNASDALAEKIISFA
jgi:rhamnosyltransferase subunit B